MWENNSYNWKWSKFIIFKKYSDLIEDNHFRNSFTNLIIMFIKDEFENNSDRYLTDIITEIDQNQEKCFFMLINIIYELCIDNEMFLQIEDIIQYVYRIYHSY